jgi:hypothetical protein
LKSQDYICISGAPLITLEVAAIVMQKFGFIQYLYYEPLYNKYLLRATNEVVTEPPEEVDDE